MTKKTIFIGVLLLIVFSFFSLGSNSKQEKINDVSVTPIVKDTFSYKGEQDKDALIILKEKVAVKQDKSGLVVSIGGRKAENKNREYWSFYVNGKMANVGPADYKTTDRDLIEWKIEKY